MGHKGSYIKILGVGRRIRIFKNPRFHKTMTLAYPLPWDTVEYGKTKGHANRPPALKAVNEALKNIEHNYFAGIPLHQRLEGTSKVMTGKSFGGVKKPYPLPPVSEDELKRRISEAATAIATPRAGAR